MKVHTKIHASSGQSIELELETRTLDKLQIHQKARKALGICWLIAIACLPLPPIHWVVTPFFFVYGVTLFFKNLKSNRVFLPFHFRCPNCEKEIHKEEISYSQNLSIHCEHCGYLLRILSS